MNENPKPKRILFSLVGQNIKAHNGTTIRAISLAKLLNEMYDSELLIAATNDELPLPHEISNINKKAILAVEKRPQLRFWLFPKLVKQRPEIVFICGEFATFPVYFIFSRIMGFKLIFEAESIWSLEGRLAGKNIIKMIAIDAVEKFTIKNADYVVVLSNDIMRFYSSMTRNICILDAILTADFWSHVPITDTSSLNERRKLGLIGPFNQKRNSAELQFLYDNIDKFDDKIDFIVIGKCEQRVANPRISYTGLIDNKEDYIRAISGVNAVLVPSQIATFGPLTKIIEPMACGVPVFTTPKGLIGLDHVEEGKDIIVSEATELPAKVNALIFDDNSMLRLGIRAQSLMKRYFSEERARQIIKQIIDAVELQS